MTLILLLLSSVLYITLGVVVATSVIRASGHDVNYNDSGDCITIVFFVLGWPTVIPLLLFLGHRSPWHHRQE